MSTLILTLHSGCNKFGTQSRDSEPGSYRAEILENVVLVEHRASGNEISVDRMPGVTKESPRISQFNEVLSN